MRKVTIRAAALKTVDYALRDCLRCSQSIKALVRNTIILNVDQEQPDGRQLFAECQDPPLRATEFSVGHLSILAAWDLFDAGSTPSENDWIHSLSLEQGVAQSLSRCL